ncbi:MAG: alanine--tRNA ligase [Bdellovibrionales bacterium RIFOXYD12_FULL_39_22]|nr:MAG: alanine--tRNA ligase [Bdellovibrionales bacterium RIFOXYB1_FULL_39_21]OFZ42231.1 MAG: alanine--tRNA ligase [Bdellovibrionales bacterium RIFOXYC12_FULL_39_17]OFZ46677.1 MAG: alanine--tRNA ligase [Bdellovibrionales bacterium RIFOXYC1_FULL_39_130]OFZ76046.1 MAG: alanine--tRNA ligase [Bdellovibrionales bacterium RIFOXYD1_FULL_39_84]OFZ93030.1 MAG: alanine--tRNA ligase [Bdellovibrionales bacterium RIFOXYD12_FULL_39_22]HLE09921.1 alanine--tRNA ligase [Bacteriovoracaceae bacterium]
MKKLSSYEIREKFLEFFQEMDHLKISSSSIIPKNDNTLLFINSGMAPLKRYFLGQETPPKPRLCNVQPCIRTKDIDDVGDRHHLTIFEMLGSWSIGDYYKEKAVALAYDLLVNRLGFDSNRLYASVYRGNPKLNLPADEVSAKAWEKAGIKKEHIVRLGEDNFWGPAGDSGPCGPCTEVFYDTGEQFGPAYLPGGEFDTTKRYIEIWNAGVFMEFNKSKEGEFTSLPLKSVDTGAGLERLAMIINGHESVYETDLLAPILKIVQERYGVEIRKARMITDHMRAAVFILAEGVNCSNEGQGYIPRRLIRKVVSALVSSKVSDLNLGPVVDKIIEILSPVYLHLKNKLDLVKYNIGQEVKDFYPVITNGLERIEKEVGQLAGKKFFSGKVVCDLMTTHGLPFDVIQSDLKYRDIEINMDEFDHAYEEHKKISRVIKRGDSNLGGSSLDNLLKDLPPTDFAGYEQDQLKGKITQIIVDGAFVSTVGPETPAIIITDKTSFYGESGGQVGDCGVISSNGAQFLVEDTGKERNIYLHYGKMKAGKMSVGHSCELAVDVKNRNAIKRNHSATHLLHAALHKVVGIHALQKGSHVTADRLRFDFSNNTQVSYEQLKEIERQVNGLICANIKRTTNVMDYDKAVASGAMALFGENYTQKVRVVALGDSSIELCGGTHVDYSGEIGTFLITQETSVAKGVRRIEAVTGSAAIAYLQEQQLMLKNSADFLKVGVDKVFEQVQILKKRLSEQTKQNNDRRSLTLEVRREELVKIKNLFFKLVEGKIEEGVSLKEIGDQMMDKKDADLLCLLTTDDKALKVFVWSGQNSVAKVFANELLVEMLRPVGGKGGGRASFAQGGTSQETTESTNLIFKLAKTEIATWIERKL